jgi:hypothetical protein
MQVITGTDIWPELKKALGLEGRCVTALDFKVRPDEHVTITLTELVDKSQGEKLAEVLSRYELHEIDDPR